jgi:4-amino-4-deoxy-L-arabinose transferase-like glycosyltransferase
MPARRWPWLAAAALAVTFALLAGNAMRHTSVTFDEIMFASAGARGLETGDFTLVNEHPRLAHYLYGIPAWLTASRYPAENGRWNQNTGYDYSRAFYFDVGNDPERLAFNTRLVAVVLGALLVFATFALTRRHLGDGPALLAATLVAFMPDVLAHAGVAYSDLPAALAIFVAAYALDAAVRMPTIGRVALAAVATALSLAVKGTGILLLPILAGLIALEALSGRWRERAWWRALVWRATPVFALVSWAVLVAVYLGDAGLAEFARATINRVVHGSSGVHYGHSALLFGERRLTGWWYFFPVAFVLKTPAAFHGLMLLGAVGAILAWRGRGRGREWLASPLRVPLVAGTAILLVLMNSSLNIGIRHAMPGVAFLCVLVAWGVAQVWRRSGRPVHALVAVLLAWNVVSVVRTYPHFLAYLTEYTRGRMALYDTLVDSNTDWGQGLLALRDFMRERGIDQVYLSYFGSGSPEGYGIRYHAMRSHFPLRGNPGHSEPPRYAAISATNLAGTYVRGDPFAKFRTRKPFAVVAGTIWIYELAPGEVYSSK